jgi:hypothetical protein
LRPLFKRFIDRKIATSFSGPLREVPGGYTHDAHQELLFLFDSFYIEEAGS